VAINRGLEQAKFRVRIQDALGDGVEFCHECRGRGGALRVTFHMGRLEGRQKAISTPVITADPSFTVDFSLSKYFWIRNSNSTHEITAVAVTIRVPIPNM
jgi:hypothetical protein